MGCKNSTIVLREAFPRLIAKSSFRFETVSVSQQLNCSRCTDIDMGLKGFDLDSLGGLKGNTKLKLKKLGFLEKFEDFDFFRDLDMQCFVD